VESKLISSPMYPSSAVTRQTKSVHLRPPDFLQIPLQQLGTYHKACFGSGTYDDCRRGLTGVGNGLSDAELLRPWDAAVSHPDE
jgi:hypothetical protein